MEGENVPAFGMNYDENLDIFSGSLNLTREQLMLAEAYQVNERDFNESVRFFTQNI